MTHVRNVLLAIILLLSLAAGLAKVLSTPAEVQFFASAGLAEGWLLPLGLVQLLGAIAVVVARLRRIGLLAIAGGFALSSAVIFATGNMTFGLVSLIPVALAMLLAAWTPQA